MTPYFDKGAALSDCGRYRYVLWRRWDPALPELAIVMLNPSTADADKDDHTIRRCVSLAAFNGYGGIHVVNLFAYRATFPLELREAADPVGPDNDRNLRYYTGHNLYRVCCAWGTHGALHDRARYFYEHLVPRNKRLYCFVTTKNGHPGHPARIPNGPLFDYYGPREWRKGKQYEPQGAH